MNYKLYYFILGCSLPNRFTEQHDVFFGIGKTPADLIPALKVFWPEAENLHIDCWREVTNVNDNSVNVFTKDDLHTDGDLSLYFINLGGYKKGDFDELHFKDIFAASSQADAIKLAKKTPFYLQNGFKGAVAHVDNKYGVAVDEIYPITEILSAYDKENYRITVTNNKPAHEDKLHLGYTTLSKWKQF
jgi:hypothetical protein